MPPPRLFNLLLHRAERFMAGPACASSDPAESARASRKFLWLEGLFSNASESFVANFVTPFALAFGASNAQIGTLASATNVASALGLLPGARLEERIGRRKQIFMWCTGVLARVLLLALVLLPLLSGNSAIFLGLCGVVVARSFLNQLCYPAWSALVSDLVPERIRGRYFGSRNIAVSLAALVCTPFAGFLINRTGVPHGYQLSFAIAVALGFVGTLLFHMVKDPGGRCARIGAVREAPVKMTAIFREHPRFAMFTALAFIWHLSLQTAGPFFAVYQIQNLGANVAHIGILASVGAFTGIIGQRVWGAHNDRKGAVWVLCVTGFLVPIVPLAWAFIPSWGYLPVIEAISGFIWAGYWLASFNLLIMLSPEGSRSRFVAVHQSVIAVASFIGPVLGGILVSMISIKGLFLLSAAGRFAVSLLFLFLIAGRKLEKEPG